MRAVIKTRVVVQVALALAALAMASCASNNPTTRIQNNPAMYEGLGAQDRSMVAEGRIREGMHKDGVFLAWGRPDRVRSGSEGGQRLDTWAYYTTRSTWQRGVGVGVGNWGGRPRWGGGYWGHRGRGFYDGFSNDPWVDYVSVETARVRFLDDQVVAWEMLR